MTLYDKDQDTVKARPASQRHGSVWGENKALNNMRTSQVNIYGFQPPLPALGLPSELRICVSLSAFASSAAAM
jgi:hypothetical protein